MDEARKLLDSLMGTHRNVDRKEAKAKRGQNFKEDNVCKFYLLGFCPQHEDLFHSTKRDIGKCHKVHSEAMRQEFEAHPDRTRYQHEYERHMRHYLEELVRGADEWVSREKRNIQAANQQIEESGPNEIARAEIKKLNDQATELFAEAESLAEDGNFDESKVRLELAEEVKRRASDWEDKARTMRTEDVCEVCGSRMESGDPSKAKFRHEDGKIHLGYVKIRQWLSDVRRRVREHEEERQQGFEDRDARERERRRSRSGGRAELRHRGRERERRDRDRSRSRDRSPGRGRHADEYERGRDGGYGYGYEGGRVHSRARTRDQRHPP
mmetsp:Transcript_63312/g.196056  ORF Transcript_63312/g.196056 Transcript_63312/m.196056 type:complete len:325 (-) Transcript_63312:29-1003(-)